jgi:ABC-2 type transport system ATP-binding protein
MIAVDHLFKRFGSNTALNDVTFAVNAGEIVGLLGPNGAGKTTVMRVLTGYLPPTSGTARVAGFDVQETPIAARKRIGYLPETVPVYSELTVNSYLRFIADLREIPRSSMNARIATCMEQVGIGSVSHRLIGHLSKGYRQRVGLAQALLHDPDILILDEPTVGLDPKQVVEIRQVIRELALRRTVILSSHILPEVSQICSRIIIIDAGQIVAEDTQAGLEKRLKGTERLFVILKAPIEDALTAIRAIPGVRSAVAEGPDGIAITAELGRDLREDVAGLATNRRWPILELRPVSMSLEQVFLKLTTREPAGDGEEAQA